VASQASDPAAGDALEWVTRTLLDRSRDGDSSPASALFLLRRYVIEGGDDLRAALESGLARQLESASTERDARVRCQGLGLFAEASVVSDDPRLPAAVNEWLARVIDDLEQVIRSAYEPGEGLMGASLIDQLRTALALLTAFELTGRLPYSMLAAELLQFARRTGWDAAAGVFGTTVAENSCAVQLISRLTVLHRDPEYTVTVALGEDIADERDAARALAALAPRYRDQPDAAADYGLALLDHFALRDYPN
jgi:hypothetical protein